jgi:two-component system, NtrC family, nitrogen regulation sensor histidine kinase NtrY
MQQSLFRELRVCTVLLENGMVELTIADTGSGLTADMRERLFLPYFSTKQRGTGLGLAIAAKIIQEHQGTIRAEKNEPAGAKFIVELRPASSLDLDSDASPFAATQNGNHTEFKSAEAQAAATPPSSTAHVEDDLASTVARGQN